MKTLNILIALVFSIFVLNTNAFSQDADAMQKQIDELQNQIQDLTIKMKGVNKKTAKIDDAPKFKIGPGFSVKHGKKSFKVHGRMHWDVGYYGEVKDQDVYGSGTNIRRARLGFKGKADDFSFTATFDKGASAKAAEDVGDQTSIDEIHFSYHPTKTMKLSVGKLKMPMYFEEAISSNDLSFIERSVAIDIFSDKQFGPKRPAVRFTTYDKKLGYFFGAAHGFGPENKIDNADGNKLNTVRAAFAPVLSKTEVVHFGAWAATVDFGAGYAASLCKLEYRAELNVTDAKPLKTSSIHSGNNVCEGAQHYGLEAAYLGQGGQFWALGEYTDYTAFRSGVDGADVPDYNADSSTFSMGYVLNGKKRYSIKKAAFKAPKVKGKWPNKGSGVWEVATRYSHVDMDDNGSSLILGGVMDNYTLGLNWYINGNAMIKANYIRSIMNNKAAQNAGATSASLNGGGASTDIYGMRFQYKF